MARRREQYTGEEELAILRKHLLEGVVVSGICDEYGLQPTVFHRWQKQAHNCGNRPILMSSQDVCWRRIVSCSPEVKS